MANLQIYDADLSTLPFYGISDYNLHIEFMNTKDHYKSIFQENGLKNLLNNSLSHEVTSTFDCQYYDEYLFVNKFNKDCCNQTAFSSFHINLQSSLKNLHLLKSNLEYLNYSFTVIGITESGNRTQPQLDDAFPGYNCFSSTPVTNKGGVVVYVLKEIFSDITLRPELSSRDSDIESLCLELTVGKQKIVCCTVYRHPNTNVEKFENYLSNLTNTLLSENVLFYIQGDINIDLLKTGNAITQKYLDCILPYNVMPCITKPTRLTDSSITLVDHMNIFRPLELISAHINSGCFLLDISDHLGTFFIMDQNIGKGAKLPAIRPKIRIYSQRNMHKFEEKLSNTTWNNVYEMQDCDDAFNAFHNKFSDIYHTCFPLTTLSRKKYKDKVWLTAEISAEIRNKNRLYRQYIKKPNDVTLQEKLRHERKQVAKHIKEAKRSYYRSQLTADKVSVVQIWKVYSELMGKNRKKDNKIDKLVVDGIDYKTDKEISDTFNSFFSTIGSNLAQTFPNDDNYKTFLGNHINNTMFINPLNKIELLKLINSLDKKKSSGPDDISPKVVCQYADKIADPLTHIFNLSLTQGVFPARLKLAKVIPIYKKESHTNPGNYRPISLLSIFSKLLEKIMYTRLYSFLTQFKILFDLQFGFRKDHSTILALIEIIDNIRKEIDQGNSVLGIYLDLSKAFDTVNHKILLSKLDHYGIRGTANDWFRSYLTGRSQKVFSNNTYSSELPINVGVPQGSVLGPLLFLIYVNDIANVLPNQNIRLFADDTNIFVKGNDINSLQLESNTSLNKLHEWFTANQLSLNIAKTCFTLFSKKINSANIRINLGNTSIPCVDDTKYLGVYLDKDLNFKTHINHVKIKLTKLTSIFHYISQFLDDNDVRRVYFAYIYPYIKYGIEIYGMCSKSNLKPIQGVQNKLLKIACHCDRYASPSLLHKKLNIFNIHELISFFILNFVYKQVNGLLPPVFNSYYTVNSDLGLRRHRSERELHVPYFRLEFGRKSIQCAGAQMYNKLSDDIKTSASIDIFKKSLKLAFQNNEITAEYLLGI